jgi:hypothetical protein
VGLSRDGAKDSKPLGGNVDAAFLETIGWLGGHDAES